MKLKLRCLSCREEFDVKYKSITRPDLEDEVGEYFKERCPMCNMTREYHVNDVKAYNTKSSNLLGTFIGIFILIGVTLFFWNKGYITNIGLLIGGGVIAASNMSFGNSNCASFNKYRTRRSPKI